MSSIDFRRLKSEVTTIALLKKMGWSANCITADGSRGWCPMHSTPNGRSRSFWVHLDNCWWYCHSCKVGGGLLDLALLKLAPTIPDAVQEVCDLMGIDVPYLKRSAANRRPRATGRGNVGGRGAQPRAR